MPAPTDTHRDFLTVAANLALLTSDAAREISTEAAAKNVGPAQVALQRGLLSIVQVDIVETLLHPQEIVPGYEILGLLGQGGMGVVYRARQLNLDRPVALKTVLVDQMTDASSVARFEQEAVTLAKLRHPHVVAAYDFGRHKGRLFFAMELVEGEDVEQLIRRKGPLDEATAWGLARQAAAGLAQAAALGVVHRDIKPANLLLVEPPLGFPLPAGLPLVKIADFGLALLTTDVPLHTRLTSAGSAVGSPHYMAPEQLDGQTLDGRADIYALGATVYHLLSGRPPFWGKSLAEIVGAKLGREAPSLLETCRDVSSATAELVAQMMAPNPDERIADYSQLIQRIDALGGRNASPLPFGAGETLPRMRSADAALPTRKVGVDSPRSGQQRPRTVLLAVLSVAVIVVAAAVGAAFIPSFLKAPLPDKPNTVATGWEEDLFDGRSLRGWLPPSRGVWNVARDEENAKVLAGEAGLIARPLMRGDAPHTIPLEFYRLTVFVSPREATAVEIQFGIDPTVEASSQGFACRLTKEGAQLIQRDSTGDSIRPRGKFLPVGKPSGSVHVVTIERLPEHYWVYIDEQLLGVVAIGRKPALPEFRLLVEGGPAWFSDLHVAELALPTDWNKP